MRKIPLSLLFKMFAGGKFYSCQICIIFAILFFRLAITYDLSLVFFIIDFIVIGIMIRLWTNEFNKME
ncbi:hypothetical protein CGZ75_23745 [Paenibacillus herberti]|uniref:Uncharacterized protein n=1 Tax=Paenibacillus herberti TaxID=1619309 RepID=A0A229NTE8_9BACL|nr:hypothetical protein CGZ75_23745 [Paenibacillus herberti]